MDQAPADKYPQNIFIQTHNTHNYLSAGAPHLQKKEAMDREPEEFQHLGAVGIVGKSFTILRSCCKSLGSGTLALALPLSFVILAHGPLTHLFFHKLAMDEFFGGPVAEGTRHQIYLEWGGVLLIELSYVAFMLPFSLLSTSAVVYTVACLYTGNEPSYATVISAVPRVWRRLTITFLWFFAIMFAYYIYVAAFLVSFLWNLIDKLNCGVLWFLVVGIATVIFCVHVYMSMVWQLASVVSVVEEKYGLGAMKKSNELIKGKCGAAVGLNVIYLVTVGITWQLFEVIVVQGGRHNMGVRERTANGALLLVLQCAVNLMWLLSQSVFYFVCKAYHNQSIDKSALSDHLEGYVEEYVPLKNGLSAIQLEHLDP